MITKTLHNIDDSHKYGVKSVHIDHKILNQELERLFSILKNRNDILCGTKNIFPEIEILTEYEEIKVEEEQSEYEDNFEDESKASQKENTARSEKSKKNICTRKYFLRFSHLQNDKLEEGKLRSGIDYLCEWPACTNKKYYGRKELKESESTVKINKSKNKSIKNAKTNKITSTKKTPSLFKKMMSIYFLEPEN